MRAPPFPCLCAPAALVTQSALRSPSLEPPGCHHASGSFLRLPPASLPHPAARSCPSPGVSASTAPRSLQVMRRAARASLRSPPRARIAGVPLASGVLQLPAQKGGRPRGGGFLRSQSAWRPAQPGPAARLRLVPQLRLPGSESPEAGTSDPRPAPRPPLRGIQASGASWPLNFQLFITPPQSQCLHWPHGSGPSQRGLGAEATLET